MPFAGRLSDACGPCRRARLRCDRIQPSCAQYRRKSIHCFGYRDVSMLRFKEESESAARKVQWEKNGVLYPSSLPEQTLDLPLYCSLTPSHDELALNYFMSSFTLASPFDYLPKIYNTIALTDQDAVSSAVLAVSFASFSLRVGGGKLMDFARMHYSRALLRTNMALASPTTATLDSSLVSVLLLGFYEAIASSSRQSSVSWTTHMLGAVELIRMRGRKQLGTELGKRLFWQTCNNIRAGCIQRGVAVPEEFIQLYEKFKHLLDPNIPNVRLGPLMDKVASLKERALRVLPVQKLSGIYDDALQLQKEAREQVDMLPDSWLYEINPPYMTPSCAYQGLTHQYPDHRIARHWNTLRLIQLLLNEVVWHVAALVACAKGVTEMSDDLKNLDTVALQATASADSAQLVTDVLASAPQFLDNNGTTFTLPARFLIIPLVSVAQISLTPKLARQYAIWCLREISIQARLPQALLAAKAVELGLSTDW